MYEQNLMIPRTLNGNYQSMQVRNMMQNPYLPIINTRQQQMVDQQYRHVQNSMNYISNRAYRSLKYQSKNNNFPLYDPGMYNLINSFPQNMLNYRPIRYFFQRPVYVDLPQTIVYKTIDNVVTYTPKNKAIKTYAIPVQYQDLIRNGEILNQASAKVIEPREVQNQLRDIEQQKNDLINRKEMEYQNVGEKLKRGKYNAKAKIRKLVRNITMFRFYKIYMKFSQSLKLLKSNEDIIVNNAKFCLDEITAFIVDLLRTHLEDYCSKSLKKKT